MSLRPRRPSKSLMSLVLTYRPSTRWRTFYDEQKKGVKVSELESLGASHELAERIIRQQDEIEAYQKKVAEQALIIDILKKLRKLGPLPPESELSGLIAMEIKLAQKKQRAK
jgi:hypothetical protein